MLPRVSVIIPTYNRWSYLQMTIESVLAQTYPQVELIIIDDGSTDDTAEGLRGYGDRIRVIQQSNQGGTAARNTGIQAATGDYLTFLDHDDLILPTKLEKQVTLLEAHPEWGAAHCRWAFIDPQGTTLTRIGPLPEGAVYKTLVLGCFLWSGAPLVRRRYIEQIGGFDPTIWSSDWDLWLRLAGVGCLFGGVQQVLGAYRIMPDSTMADVHRTEQMDIRLLDKVFAQPDIAPDIRAVRDEAYGIWRFWLARRYYATGSPADGQRNLAEALRLHPAFLADEPAFLETLCNEALDVRVANALGFVEAVWSHLPPAAKVLEPKRRFVEGQIYLGLALRAFARGAVKVGQDHLHAAAQREADLGPHLARQCAAVAVRLSDQPLDFAETVLRQLPPEIRFSKTQRARLLSHIAIASAFEDFHLGDHKRAGRGILTAARLDPSHLKTRGALSVLAKSLPHMLLKRE